MSDTKTFLITGVSTGFGRALAIAALASGHRVVGTVRKQQDARAFESLSNSRAHARILDVTDNEAVNSVVDETESTVGPIDVLVCNAGFGHEGIIEESSMAELRHQFDVNVFGAVATIKALLPHMRPRRSGHIIVITSMGGLVAFPGLGFYHGSKFAMEGIIESLGKEVSDLGIHTTAVEPGAFRTDWAGRSMVRTPRTIADYDELFDPLRAKRSENSGNQPGDPEKAVQAILEIIAADDPPSRLLLGTDALRVVESGRSALEKDIETWRALSSSTDFDDHTQTK